MSAPKVQLRIKKLDSGEYKVEWKEDGIVMDSRSYKTPDKRDAESVLNDMAKNARRVGYRVRVMGK